MWLASRWFLVFNFVTFKPACALDCCDDYFLINRLIDIPKKQESCAVPYELCWCVHLPLWWFSVPLKDWQKLMASFSHTVVIYTSVCLHEFLGSFTVFDFCDILLVSLQLYMDSSISFGAAGAQATWCWCSGDWTGAEAGKSRNRGIRKQSILVVVEKIYCGIDILFLFESISVQAQELDFEQYQQVVAYSRNEGLFFKNLYPAPKPLSLRMQSAALSKPTVKEVS